MYLPFDTEKLLGVPPGISITPYSGAAGIAFWINYHFKLKNNEKLTKDDPRVIKIYQEVLKYFEDGNVLSISDEEMMKLVKKYIPELSEKIKIK
ncbi:MAG: hypothetical protein QXG78_03030, partial [Candidatus Methanomethyliaceae archaeon]